jgi:hypothetical protein
VTSTVLPAYIRRELALAVWVRAVLLENDEMGKAFVPLVGNLRPELKEDLNSYLSAENNEAGWER